MKEQTKDLNKTARMPSKLLFFITALLIVILINFLGSKLVSQTTTSKPSAEETINISNPKINIGTNLAALAYWSTQFPFKDFFKISPNWTPQKLDGVGNTLKWDTEEYKKLDLDANGWVRSLHLEKTDHQYNAVISNISYGTEKEHFPKQLLVLYEGDGEIKYGFDARKNIGLSRPGRDVLDITLKDAQFYLRIEKTNPKNYLRNIRIIEPKYEKTYQKDIFNPEFIKRTMPYKTLRFMDWMRTNGSTQKNWQDRPTPQSATLNERGAPVEVMVDLANTVKADAWFTLPHLATDDYIKHFAQYVKTHLNPSLKVYVEYSNEVWNPAFQQGNYIEQQGKIAFNGSFDPDYTKRINWYSQRAVEVIGLWNQVFDNQNARIIGVMGAQSANQWSAEQALKYSWAKSPKTSAQYGVKAIAIAPYFGYYIGDPSQASEVQTWKIDQLFKEITVGGVLKKAPKGGALPEVYNQVAGYGKLAKKNNLQLIAYEGGQHLTGSSGVENNQAITDLFIKANRDPKMKTIYKQFITKWGQLGGGLFVHFNDIGPHAKWGSWGALETISQVHSPKYDALVELIGKKAKN